MRMYVAGVTITIAMSASYLIGQAGVKDMMEGEVEELVIPKIQTMERGAAPAYTYDAITERPLFVVSRGQWSRTEGESEGESNSAAVGIIATGVHMHNHERFALMAFPDGNMRWMREGQQVGEWQLLRVEASRMQLSRGSEEVVVEVRKRR